MKYLFIVPWKLLVLIFNLIGWAWDEIKHQRTMSKLESELSKLKEINNQLKSQNKTDVRL